jgi:hypothetical protein
MNPTQSSKRSWLAVGLMLLVWVLIGLAIWQRTTLFDWWRLRGYDPSSEVAALADATTMNDHTRNLFYVYHPDIEPRDTFNGHCRSGEFTIILGCYVSTKGIYLYKISDPRLNGVEEVTAAHETLHAAYDRLSGKERAQVDAWTEQAFQQLTSQRIKDTIEQYRKSDPSSVPNELHSILGTEVRDLPAPLENYYKKYFIDRAKIVDFSDMYESAFTTRKALVTSYETQLKNLKAQVEQANENLKTKGMELQEEYDRLNTNRSSVEPNTFSLQASQYNAKVKTYNNLVENTRALISKYNSIYEQYQKVVLEQQDLYQSIDSRPQTISTQ